jgi:hypothetical protein
MAGLLDWGFFARGTNGPTAKREWRAEPQLLARKAVHKRLTGRKNRPKAESGQLSQMESTKRTVGICRTRAGAGNSEKWPTNASYPAIAGQTRQKPSPGQNTP